MHTNLLEALETAMWTEVHERSWYSIEEYTTEVHLQELAVCYKLLIKRKLEMRQLVAGLGLSW